MSLPNSLQHFLFWHASDCWSIRSRGESVNVLLAMFRSISCAFLDFPNYEFYSDKVLNLRRLSVSEHEIHVIDRHEPSSTIHKSSGSHDEKPLSTTSIHNLKCYDSINRYRLSPKSTIYHMSFVVRTCTAIIATCCDQYLSLQKISSCFGACYRRSSFGS